jgi:type IV pilus assembly protein PilC
MTETTSPVKAPAKVVRETSLKKKSLRVGRISIMERMFFARYLALMLRSGIQLAKGLEFLEVQIENARFKQAIASIRRDVTSGVYFSDSLAKFPKIFSELFINMVRAGETAGNLEEVLDIIAEELRKASELRSKVISALIYPAILVFAMIGVSVFIVFFVFPRIIQVYESLNVALPITTKILVSVVLFINRNVSYFAVGAAAVLIFLAVWLNTRLGRRQFDWVLLRLPIFRTIVRKINTVQFARTFSSLLRSGVSTPVALEITSKTFRNSYYRDAALAAATGIRQGKRMSEILERNVGIFPPIVSQMVSVGEETGALTDILRQVASFFETEVDTFIENLTKIIEPLLMIGIGSVVGFIAIATVQLIYASLQGVT